MKNRRKFHPIFYSFAVFSALVLAVAAAAVGLFYSLFSIPEPEGLSPASWPQRFTDNFSFWIAYRDGDFQVKESGLARLDEYGLWLQAIDESGREIYAYHKPEGYPERYSASALLELGTGAYGQGHTVFTGSLEEPGAACSYLIGFPYAIGRYTLYYNGERIDRLLPAARTILFSALLVLASLIFGYVFWLSRKLSGIANGIRSILLRRFSPMQEKGAFCDIYGALNRMDAQIRESDAAKEATEQARREWIANITHDLKTPLSPVKGYAELLAENDDIPPESIREYGQIMLKNVSHIEKLLQDLKLTWQLDSGTLPFHPREVPLTRYLRESIIDIVNNPSFSEREVVFESGGQELTACLDPDLFRRAVQNLIVNALVHNPPDTKVTVSLRKGPEGHIAVSVRDDGNGISEAQQARLFHRYYRGTNTREKPEGSGLGLAIARQIAALHGGDIRVISAPGAGAEFILSIPGSL